MESYLFSYEIASWLEITYDFKLPKESPATALQSCPQLSCPLDESLSLFIFWACHFSHLKMWLVFSEGDSCMESGHGGSKHQNAYHLRILYRQLCLGQLPITRGRLFKAPTGIAALPLLAGALLWKNGKKPFLPTLTCGCIIITYTPFSCTMS